MMHVFSFCGSCGEGNKLNARYCEKCGKKITRSYMGGACTCGESFFVSGREFVFCTKCGKRIILEFIEFNAVMDLSNVAQEAQP